MSQAIPRLRVFAGPNGSGKSTLKAVLPPELLGVYINPDDMERQIRQSGMLDFSQYGLRPTSADVHDFLQASPLLKRAGMIDDARRLVFENGCLRFSDVSVNAYYASALSDFIRHQLLEARRSFTFETVMSSPDKIEFLKKAKDAGFRVYLYFVATEDPDINVDRVRLRVRQGLHDVPENKIRERYTRSLELLYEAVVETHRAYIFDNSGEGEDAVWLAEITDGDVLDLKTTRLPSWFKRALWDKFVAAD